MSAPEPRRLIREIRGEAHYLRRVEREGNSPATPFLATVGLLGVIVPAFLCCLESGSRRSISLRERTARSDQAPRLGALAVTPRCE
jgi:hypothetical protein